MIFLHAILALILGSLIGSGELIMLGLVIPDLDHLYVYFFKHKMFSWKKLKDSFLHEEKYKIRSKTPLVHSFFGMFLFTFIFMMFMGLGALFFGLGYFLHLVLDYPDTDVKQYLYPSKKEFKGFLPIWSKQEQILTIGGVILLIFVAIPSIYLNKPLLIYLWDSFF